MELNYLEHGINYNTDCKFVAGYTFHPKIRSMCMYNLFTNKNIKNGEEMVSIDTTTFFTHYSERKKDYILL